MKKKMTALALLIAGGLAASLVGPVHGADPMPNTGTKNLAVATFAGGCFWCVESAFEKLPGVAAAVSGYSGGQTMDPTYRQVAAGGTGHTEAVQVFYDPKVITYAGLLEGLWRMMDPTDGKGQFVDRGSQYRPAIFYHDLEQKAEAERSRMALEASGRFKKPLATEIVPFERFYRAEEYHQDYYKKNPIRYKVYTFNSGRYQFVDGVWGKDRDVDWSRYRPQAESRYTKPSDDELRRRLSPLQYRVTQQEGTERPFQNEFWDEKRAGIYVDIVTGEPLFSSTDKFKSGTGWPSFTKPLNEDAVATRIDRQLFSARTEVRSRFGGSHLGHVFNDGPAPTGLRYCINSAALRFVPKEQLVAEGYTDLAKLFM